MTALYYSGARWYNARSGRFITEDTYFGSNSNPLSLNRYIYAEDNPVSKVDPNGHGTQESFLQWLESYFFSVANYANLALGALGILLAAFGPASAALVRFLGGSGHLVEIAIGIAAASIALDTPDLINAIQNHDISKLVSSLFGVAADIWPIEEFPLRRRRKYFPPKSI